MEPVAAHRMPGTQAAPAPPPRLVRAAHEFEAQMMKELLKPMTENDSMTGEEDGSGGTGSNGALSAFASEALGKALSQRGGFGIANSIIHDLSHSGNRTESGKVTENLHDDTVISGPKSLK